MGIEYLNNINTYISEGLFFLFKISIYVFTALTIISLILLLIGQLIKSQRMKDKYIKLSMSFLILLVFIILIPIIYTSFKSLV